MGDAAGNVTTVTVGYSVLPPGSSRTYIQHVHTHMHTEKAI